MLRSTRSFLWLVAVLLPWAAHASQFGRDGFSGRLETNGGADCTACHSPGAPPPTLVISGPSAVSANATVRFEAVLSGGPAVTGGINLATSSPAGRPGEGTLVPADGDLRTVAGELAHTRPKTFSGDNVRFTFDWTAPSYNGPVTLHGAGNASNGAVDLLGDGVATTAVDITVVGGEPSPPPPPPPPPAQLQLEALVSGLNRPVGIRHAGDARLFIVEQGGRIRTVMADGTLRQGPFLDITNRVERSGNEQGLLGLAFDPAYASNRNFYVYYTYDPGSGNDRTRVSRFRVTRQDANYAWPDSETVLLEFEQPYANHNGGDLQFGPDGYLYIASGDGGSGGDPRNFAQNPNSLLGKILRIDVNGADAGDCNLLGARRYGLPSGNAHSDGPGNGGCDEIYASGLRNPWRMSFDRGTGDLWIADVGQNAVEEINLIRAGTAGGLNLGWRCREGDDPFDTRGCAGTYHAPVYVGRHSEGYCSVTGGYVYRGSRQPSLVGRYLFSDFCRTAISGLASIATGGGIEELLPSSGISQPASFGEDIDGELLVASLNGTVYRIVGGEPPTGSVGEAGAVVVSQSSASDWHQVNFTRSYQRPVVVMGPPSRNDPRPVSVRVRNVSATGFEFQLEAFDYLPAQHGSERVGWVVVEAGAHVLSDGRRLIAGRGMHNHVWRRVRFDAPFAEVPVVLVQTASNTGGQTVIERIRNLTTSGFDLRLQEEEANDDRHSLESAHWIALPPALSSTLEAGVLNDVDPSGALFGIGIDTAGIAPVLIAELQSHRGADPVVPGSSIWIRRWPNLASKKSNPRTLKQATSVKRWAT